MMRRRGGGGFSGQVINDIEPGVNKAQLFITLIPRRANPTCVSGRLIRDERRAGE